MDAWKDVMQSDLSRDAFQEVVLQYLGAVDMDWMVEIQSERGLRPIGVILAEYRMDGGAIEPHVMWFPWVTARNKLEACVRFFRETGKLMKVFIYIKAEDDALFERVWRYKVLKKGCKISDCYGKGEDAVMYYTPGPF